MRVFPALLIFCFTAALWAAPPRFTDGRTVGDLRLRLPRQTDSLPLATVETHRYTRTWSDGRSEIIDMQSPADVWHRSQHLSAWREKDGTTLTLARATTLPISDWPQKHLPVAEIETALEKQTVPVTPETEPAWLTAFTGQTFSPLRTVRVPPNLSALRFYQGNTAIAAFFYFDPNATGQAGAPASAYVFLVTPTSPRDLDAARRNLETQFLPALQYRAAVSSHRPGGAVAGIRSHPSREAARQTITGLSDWYAHDTPDYIVLTDLRRNATRTIAALTDELQVLRTAFTHYFPPAETNREDDVSVIRVFSDASDYRRYVGEGVEWSAGLFSPLRRELVIRGDGESRTKDQRESMRRIFYHEGFHQFLFHYGHGLQFPVWFNEGHAAFFETASVNMRARQAVPGENPHRQRILKNLTSTGLADIPGLLEMSYEDFYGGDGLRRENNYALAWGLVYYLRAAPHARDARHSAYAGVLDTYLKTYLKTRNAATARNAAFPQEILSTLSGDFKLYWEKKRFRAGEN